MIPEGLRVSSGDLWMSAALALAADVIFMALLIWRIKPVFFRELRWALVITAAVIWGIFAVVLVTVFWESYYRYFYPAWLRSGWILLFVALGFGLLALAFHWLALRIPGHPLVNFCLLAGCESVLEHAWGFYGLKILAIPLLSAASPASILAFSFPEYVFYWCIIICLAALLKLAGSSLQLFLISRSHSKGN